jgi:hypothetical protein
MAFTKLIRLSYWPIMACNKLIQPSVGADLSALGACSAIRIKKLMCINTGSKWKEEKNYYAAAVCVVLAFNGRNRRANLCATCTEDLSSITWYMQGMRY